MTNKQMKNDCERWKTAEARKWKAKNFQCCELIITNFRPDGARKCSAHPNEEEFK